MPIKSLRLRSKSVKITYGKIKWGLPHGIILVFIIYIISHSLSRPHASLVLISAMEEFDLDQSLRDSVTGLVSALGGIDYAQPSRPYVLGDDALGCLKDLKKWVKFYGSSGKLDALRCIAETNLVALDICQILGHFAPGQERDKIKWRLALNCCSPLSCRS